MFVLAMVLSVIATIVELSFPAITGYAIDSLIGGGIAENQFLVRLIPSLEAAGIAIIIIYLLNSLFRYGSRALKNIMVEKVGERLRNRLYRRIQYFSYATHRANQPGELIQRCTSDVRTYLNFFRTHVDNVGRAIFMSSTAIVMMFMMDPLLALVPISVIPFIVMQAVNYSKKVAAAFEESDKDEAAVTAAAEESISGIRVVRAFGMGEFEKARYNEKNLRYRQSYTNMGKRLASYGVWNSAFSTAQFALTLVIGGFMAIGGRISAGMLVAFCMYCEWLTWPIRMLADAFTEMGRAYVSVRRIDEILETPIDEEDGFLRPEIKGSIVYDGVSCVYEDQREQKVLENISFEIKPGQTLGILGHTGSGKSTLVKLLHRLMPYEGSIRIDGVELRDIEKSYIRDRVGLVLQDTFLFSKTVGENIDIMKRHDGREIRRVAEIAGIHKSIEDFKSGYDTLVGERGAQLSGGEKQRISISRTIIEDRNILVFDDSLSAVDAETDRRIRDALEEEFKGVTRIIISHRVSTVMDADLILVLRDGRIVERGVHDELKDAGGMYSRLWELQTRED